MKGLATHLAAWDEGGRKAGQALTDGASKHAMGIP